MEVVRCPACRDWLAELDDDGHLLRIRLYATAGFLAPHNEFIDGRLPNEATLWPQNTGVVKQVRSKCGLTVSR